MRHIDDAIAALRDLLFICANADAALLDEKLRVEVLQALASFYGNADDVLWTLLRIQDGMRQLTEA